MLQVLVVATSKYPILPLGNPLRIPIIRTEDQSVESPRNVSCGPQGSASSERTALESQLEALIRVAHSHNNGKEDYARAIATELFEDFLAVEERFAANKDATEQEVIDSLRKVSNSQFSCHLDKSSFSRRVFSLFLFSI